MLEYPRSLTQWLDEIDATRGNRQRLEDLQRELLAISSPNFRSAEYRLIRYLREVADQPLPVPQTVSSSLAEAMIAHLEGDAGFTLSLAALPGLLEHAQQRQAGRAIAILSALISARVSSAEGLLFKLHRLRALQTVDSQVIEWLWFFAVKTGNSEAEEMMSVHFLYPRRLIDAVQATSSSHVGSGGFVYLLKEEGVEPAVCKIGMTTKSVAERVRELNSSTSQHRRLVEIAAWPVNDPRLAEATVHRELDSYRVKNNREFFQIDVPAAIRLIDRVLT